MAEDFRASQIQTNQIISSGSSGTGARIVFYDISGQSTVAPNQGIIDPSKFNTGSIGADAFIFISGGIGERNQSKNSISVFGGDVFVSGNLAVEGIGTVGPQPFRLTVADYATTTNTSSNAEVVGQVIFDANEFSGSLNLRAILNSSQPAGTASIRLFELVSGSFVDIGGPGVTKLSVSGTTPTCVTSVNLFDANGFITGALGKYELRLFTETSGATAFVGGAELRPSGSFTAQTIITESFSTDFVSGTTGFRLGFNDFIETTNTSGSATTAGQVIFPGNEFSGSLTFRAVLSTSDPTATASVRLRNVTSGAFVELKSGQTILSTSNTSPTVLTSDNLFGAVNFNTGSVAIYEMQLFSSTGSATASAGGGELRPSGSFTGVTNVQNRFVSGTTGFRISVSDFITTTQTASSPEVAGQAIFPANEFSGSLTFRAVLSVTVPPATASVRLFNATSGAYVELSPGQDALSTTSGNPVVVTSQDLFGAVNFDTANQAVYEMHLHTSTGSSTIAGGGGEFRPSGSFTGLTSITSSTIFTSGTWVDEDSKLRTTASVAIDGAGGFAEDQGDDVYFYVSGTFGSGSASDNIALFGGDVKISGTLAVGTGSAFITDDRITLTSASMRNVGGELQFFDANNLTGQSLSDLVTGETPALQETYLANPAIEINSSTGSLIVSGNTSATNVGLVRISPDGGADHAALDIMNLAGDTALISFGTKNTSFGGAKLNFVSIGNTNGGITWQTSTPLSPDPVSPAAEIHYEDNSDLLDFRQAGAIRYFRTSDGEHLRFTPNWNRFENPVSVTGTLAATSTMRARGGFIAHNFVADPSDFGTNVNFFVSGTINAFGPDGDNPNPNFGTDPTALLATDTYISGTLIVGSASFIELGGSWGAIVGGRDNLITGGFDGAIAGGRRNTLRTSPDGGMLGGVGNSMSGSDRSVVVGGNSNVIRHKDVNERLSPNVSFDSAILGGNTNIISGSRRSAIIAGQNNTIREDFSDQSVIVGGQSHALTASDSVIVGGFGSTLDNADWSAVIGGGNLNVIRDAQQSVIAGGFRNSIDGVGGNVSNNGWQGIFVGQDNVINGPIAFYNAIIGGLNNLIQEGSYNSIIASDASRIGGSDKSFIAGSTNTITSSATENHDFIIGLENNITDQTRNILVGFGLFDPNEDSAIVIGGDESTNAAYATKVILSASKGTEVKEGPLTAFNGISGSLTALDDGSPYLLAGDNITLVTNSVGQIEISSSAAGGGGPDSDWTLTGSTLFTTSSVVVGQQTTTNAVGEDVFFFVSGTFGSGSAGDAVSVFGGDVRVSGTLAVGTGSSFIKENSITFTSASIRNEGGLLKFFDDENLDGLTLSQINAGSGSGDFDWVDGGGRLRTTSSVAVSSDVQFAGSQGDDVFFFVSGAVGGKDSAPADIALFGGDVHISGNLTVDGSAPGGGGGDSFFFSNTADLAETTGSLAITGSVTVSGTLDPRAGVRYNPAFITASTNITTNNFLLGVSGSAELTLTLPTGVEDGQTFIVKDAVGNASSNNIIVSSSAEQIDGASTYTIAVDFGSAQFVFFSDVSSWGVI